MKPKTKICRDCGCNDLNKTFALVDQCLECNTIQEDTEIIVKYFQHDYWCAR